ncbi:hypothetical protein EDO6_01549 [Paenibacillus xylanexedens]|nr:hypothetical protein EDO6_01549 [Paenibacillus xylanexedens]
MVIKDLPLYNKGTTIAGCSFWCVDFFYKKISNNVPAAKQ